MISLTILQGFPTAITLSGRSFVTTLPAPITTLFPIVTPGMTQELPLPGTDQEAWRSVHQQAVDWAEGSACLGRLTAGGAPEIDVNLPTEGASARGRGSRVFDNYSDHLIRLSFDINP